MHSPSSFGSRAPGSPRFFSPPPPAPCAPPGASERSERAWRRPDPQARACVWTFQVGSNGFPPRRHCPHATAHGYRRHPRTRGFPRPRPRVARRRARPPHHPSPRLSRARHHALPRCHVPRRASSVALGNGPRRPVDHQFRMFPHHLASHVASEADWLGCRQHFLQPLGWESGSIPRKCYRRKSPPV